MTSLPDYDATYRGEPSTPGGGRPPWNIGEPQPAIAMLIDAGQVLSRSSTPAASSARPP